LVSSALEAIILVQYEKLLSNYAFDSNVRPYSLVCINFILGSLLFVAGCAFWYKRYVYKSRERALVVYPFLCGSVCFTLGAYLGLFQAINVGRRGRSLLWEWAPEKDGFLGGAACSSSPASCHINYHVFVDPRFSR
jgi:hypothetical protein